MGDLPVTQLTPGRTNPSSPHVIVSWRYSLEISPYSNRVRILLSNRIRVVSLTAAPAAATENGNGRDMARYKNDRGESDEDCQGGRGVK
ncbi:hypothetical protein H5410_043476 [Solanum commersonii]|uniref:Uncharacterized protein n=1 Tax=Solanum commersonii TaxID=4109 RepID=A0A9J5XYZ5_SOLCO|nr:hypothetical protein H5410_043476 [Solanum commersonii]